MIGQINPACRQVTVIGAGVSGLLISYELDRRGYEVTLIEANERAGGLIRTQAVEWGQYETGAHSLLATAEVRQLCADLGVELASVRSDSRSRYILKGGRMQKFPLTIWEVIRTLVRACFVVSTEATSRGHATMEQWARRHLSEAALQNLLSPFLTGVYAARPADIAVGAAFPALEVPKGHSLVSAQLRKLWSKPRPVGQAARPAVKTKKEMVSPARGMGALVEALEKRLEQRLGTRFKKGIIVSDLPIGITNLVLTVPTDQAARLLQEADVGLSAALEKVSYSPLVCATVFAPRGFFKSTPSGVGVLIPEIENRQCLGVLFNSSSFPNRVSDESAWVSLTLMLGGCPRPEMVNRSGEELEQIIREELVGIFGISAAQALQAHIVLSRWKRAIPQYNGQLMDTWKIAEQGWCAQPGRVLFGNYTGQVSLRGMIHEVNNLGLTLAAGLQVSFGNEQRESSPKGSAL